MDNVDIAVTIEGQLGLNVKEPGLASLSINVTRRLLGASKRHPGAVSRNLENSESRGGVTVTLHID